MINREIAWKFAHEWLDAWNQHDVNLIMKHYANSIEFCSPIVQKVLGDPKGVVYGIEKFRLVFVRHGGWYRIDGVIDNRIPCMIENLVGRG